MEIYGKRINRLNWSTDEVETFVRQGEWENGTGSYSRITLDSNGEETIADEDDGAYYQQRCGGRLVMFHI